MNFLSGKARALSNSPARNDSRFRTYRSGKPSELGTGWVFRPLQYQSQGIIVPALVYARVQEDHGRDSPLRNVPSSGARYPLETYFVASDVEGLETGLYRYLPRSNSIVAERIDSDLTLEISTASLNFKIMTRAVVTFIWVAIPYRSVWALGNRGYRSVLIEAGHTCQNLILAAAGLGYEVFPTDMFHDELVMKMANLDHETQWPVYIAAVGKIDQDWKL